MPDREPSPIEVTKRWIALVALCVGLGSGFLSWFSSFVLLGARTTANESAITAQAADSRELHTEVQALIQRMDKADLNNDHRLTQLEDGLNELRGIAQHIDGRLSGSVEPARGRAR